jgi:hypothetical protein
MKSSESSARSRPVPAPDTLVDLHIHTTASDGMFPPAETVRLAAEARLAALAITDHDTVAGLPEAADAARAHNIELLAGVEVSVQFPNGTMHILGYGFDPAHPGLRAALQQYQRNRDERNPLILKRLAAMGMSIPYATVRAKAAGESVGRPHIAQCLVEAGFCRSTEEVFKKFLGRGAPAYVERRRATPQEAIQVIRDAGGLAALAHPGQLRRPPDEVRRIAAGLQSAGLDALETYHPDHCLEHVRTYERLARDLGLILVGGSDFHGHLRHTVRIGVGRGTLRVPYESVRQIRARLAARK